MLMRLNTVFAISKALCLLESHIGHPQLLQQFKYSLTPHGLMTPRWSQWVEIIFYSVEVRFHGAPKRNHLLPYHRVTQNIRHVTTQQKKQSTCDFYSRKEVGFKNYQSADAEFNIQTDNQVAIAVAYGTTKHEHVKHILAHISFLRELVKSKQVSLTFVASANNTADAMKKNLPKPAFDKFRQMILGL